MPPKLSARALFWWGVGLIAVGTVGNLVLPPLFSRLTYSTGLIVVQSIVGVVSSLVSATTFVGAGLVAAAFTVRALTRGVDDRYTGAAPYSPSKPVNDSLR